MTAPAREAAQLIGDEAGLSERSTTTANGSLGTLSPASLSDDAPSASGDVGRSPWRPRVALVTDFYCPTPNGVATSVHLLQRELRRRGCNAWVIAPWVPGVPDKEEAVLRVPSVPYPFAREHRLALPPIDPVLAEFDVVHTHTPCLLGLWACSVAGRQHLPHVSTFHTNYERYTHYVPGLAGIDRRWRLVRYLTRSFYNRASVVVAPSDPIGRLVRSYGVQSPVRVVPNALDASVLDDAPGIASPWPSGTRRLLTVARLAREKDIPTLLQALVEIRQHAPAHLVIVGEGPEEIHLHALCARLGLADAVTFIGAVPYQQIGSYYRLAELFLFASASETQGLVLLEAQTMGVPVVAVGAGGTVDAVADGHSGVLVEPGDAHGLALHASLLLADPDRLAALGHNARCWARRQSSGQMAEAMLAVYAEARQRAAVRCTVEEPVVEPILTGVRWI